jgi:hypothetical protein
VILSSQRLWPSLWSTLVGFIISFPKLELQGVVRVACAGGGLIGKVHARNCHIHRRERADLLN